MQYYYVIDGIAFSQAVILIVNNFVKSLLKTTGTL